MKPTGRITTPLFQTSLSTLFLRFLIHRSVSVSIQLDERPTHALYKTLQPSTRLVAALIDRDPFICCIRLSTGARTGSRRRLATDQMSVYKLCGMNARHYVAIDLVNNFLLEKERRLNSLVHAISHV